MQPQQDKRRFPRTREHGPCKLAVTFRKEGGVGRCEAKLYDFGEGGLGMDLSRSFESGQVLEIEGKLQGAAYSMQVKATARVAYCRRLEKKGFRVGVSFIEVSYRPIAG